MSEPDPFSIAEPWSAPLYTPPKSHWLVKVALIIAGVLVVFYLVRFVLKALNPCKSGSSVKTASLTCEAEKALDLAAQGLVGILNLPWYYALGAIVGIGTAIKVAPDLLNRAIDARNKAAEKVNDGIGGGNAAEYQFPINPETGKPYTLPYDPNDPDNPERVPENEPQPPEPEGA